MSDDTKKTNNIIEMDVRRAGEPGHVIGRCSTIVIMAALLAALSVTAVIVTLRSVVYNINTSVKYNVQFGVASDRALEEISVDQSQNVVEYHVTETCQRRDDSQVWAISDFNRGIEVFKVDSKSSGTVCYVTVLNQHETSSPDEFSSDSLFADISSETVELRFDAVETPVRDTSIVGPKGQRLCAGVPLYWIVPSDFLSHQGDASSRRNVIVTYVVRHRATPPSGRRRRSSDGHQRRSEPYQPSVANFSGVGQSYRHEAMASGSFRILHRYRRRRGRRRN